MRKRTKHMHLMLSDDEKERLQKLAKDEGLSMANWLRSKIRKRWRQLALPGILGICSCGGPSFEAVAISAEASTSLEAINLPPSWDANVSAETGAPSVDSASMQTALPDATPPEADGAPFCVFNGPDYTITHDTSLGCMMIVGPKGCEDFIRSKDFDGGKFIGATFGRCCTLHFSSDSRMCLEVSGA